MELSIIITDITELVLEGSMEIFPHRDTEYGKIQSMLKTTLADTQTLKKLP